MRDVTGDGPWPGKIVPALVGQYRRDARDEFVRYRKLIRPKMLTSWWTDEVAAALQQFYQDLIAGKRPRLAIGAPPQHGKSWAATDFMSWVAGKNPDLKIIFASYSDDLGMRTNLDLQRIFTSRFYERAFPRTRIGQPGWMCNTSLIEFAGHSGSFRNTTINGAINGMELHLGVIDDPVKGRAEAQSKTTRDKIWHWFADDWGARFAKDAGMLIIMTGWHVDDLLGRFIEKSGGDITVLDYPAIAEHDEPHRSKGEALFSEHKPLEFLLARKKLMSQASWESEYQQHPIVVGGGIFPIEKIHVLPTWDRQNIKRSVRYVDKAGVEGGTGSYTAMVLMHMMHDGRFVIEDVVRGHWSAFEREQKLKELAERDRKLIKGGYEIGVEQEPGSGGKESAEATIRNLAGYRVYADRVTGSKEVRAEPFAAQVQGGNLYLVAGSWHGNFLEELENFPAGKWKDQVDASVGAFTRLTQGPQFSLYSGWLD
jgi:predicted phage terminase large subunit-like protein